MILCSRLKCGCMASALLCGSGVNDAITTADEVEFRSEEEKQGRLVAWENRKSVCAERCPTHEAEYLAEER